MMKQKREYYRVKFSNDYHPSLQLDIDSYEIEDLSEYGIKFKADDEGSFMTDELLIANIVFPDGDGFELSGHIVRIENNSICLQLATPLPVHKIRDKTLLKANS